MGRRLRATALSVVLAVSGGLMGAVPAAVVTSAPAGAALGAQDLAGGVTATQLAQTIAGDGVTVSNVTFTGANVAAGKFTGAGTAASSVGFDTGVVLSSGRVAGVSTSCTSGKGIEGPNVCTNNTTDNGTAGDAALTTLAGVQTNDAAILQFNFVPQFSTVQFQYVFGSEEYLEFVNSGVNDTFGFFVNGSNCATVPGTEGTPVSVDTINTGVNAGFFRNNAGATIDTELDGLTTVLECDAAVNSGVTNTMRLAIADGGDSILDSAAFIRAGSLISGTQVSGSLSGGAQTGASISVPTGTAVTASATLSGVNASSAGGTATYSVFSDNTCTTSAGSGGTKTVSGGAVPASDAVTLNTAGTYYWKIAYSGDGLNNPSSTTCGELTETVTAPVPTLAVTSDGQATVTAGANATRTVTVTNTGAAPATGVSTALTVPAGVTLVSATPSQGTCSGIVSGAVTCTLGTIAGGGSANVQFVLQAPAAVPAGGTFSTSASATSSGGGTAGPAVSSTTVTAQSPGSATGFIPPGGTLRTGTDATPGDNTVASITLPNSGPGALVTITSVPCVPGVCLGKTVSFNAFPGYDDPTKPIKAVTIYDKSLAGPFGLLLPEYVLKENDTKFRVIPPCAKPGEKTELAIARYLLGLVIGGRSGIAAPSPCSNKKDKLSNGDLRYESLFLSGDPARRR